MLRPLGAACRLSAQTRGANTHAAVLTRSQRQASLQSCRKSLRAPIESLPGSKTSGRFGFTSWVKGLHSTSSLYEEADGDSAETAHSLVEQTEGSVDIFDQAYDMTPDKDLLRIKHDTLKHHKPLTNSLRNRVSLDCKKAGLWRGRPFKPLTLPKKRTGGRNNTGRITCRHRGGGNKRRYRIIDFKRQLWDVPATVERLEYDPNRSAFISLLNYDNGVVAYILAPQGLGQEYILHQQPAAQVLMKPSPPLTRHNQPTFFATSVAKKDRLL